MSEHHPRRESLEGFLFSRLPAREMKDTLGHLLGGCDRCQEEMSSLAAAMFTPDGAPEPRLSSAEEDAYDQAISAAFDKALECERSLTREREAGERKAAELARALRRSDTPTLPEGPASWGLCEALLEQSWALRQSDPAGMLYLADLARLTRVPGLSKGMPIWV